MATAEQYAAWIVANKDKQGTPEFETVASAYKEAKGFESQSAQTEAPQQPNSIGRQLGLTARIGIEGAAETIGILSDPIAYGMEKVTGIPLKSAGEVGRSVSDKLGLPKPQNALERAVNTTSKLMVGTGGTVKGAEKAAMAVSSPVAKSTLKMISARPDLQAASSVGAGSAGSYAKEKGAGPWTQLLASVAGGVAAPSAVQATKAILTPTKIDNVVAQAIRSADIEMDNIPHNIQKTIIADVKQAAKSKKDLSPEAIKRLADYRLTGTTPMRSSLTLKPADITRDRNLAKLSANSQDPAAQKLSNLQRDNDIALTQGLNNLGASSADDAVTAGKKVIDALQVKDGVAKSIIDKFYKQARNTSGRSAKIDHVTFTNKANDLLDFNNAHDALPQGVRNMLNSVAQGKTPLTVDVAEQYKSNIARLQRNTNDKEIKYALGLVREALEESPLLNGQGKPAIDAFNKARSANRAYMQMVDKNPALKAVRDGVEPDKFVQTFITGQGAKSNISDVKALRDSLKNNTEAVKTVRNQIVAHLKEKATGGSADEVANFSPSNFNKALKNIGDEKLNLFFTKEDVNMLKAIGRVGSYEKFQPTGSAVNNSNTASTAIATTLDWLANSSIIRKIPGGGALISNPAQDARLASGARDTLNASKSLVQETKKLPKVIPLGPMLYGASISE